MQDGPHNVMGELFPVVEISTPWKMSVNNDVMALEARDLQTAPNDEPVHSGVQRVPPSSISVSGGNSYLRRHFRLTVRN
jgi:hypothetical protein